MNDDLDKLAQENREWLVQELTLSHSSEVGGILRVYSDKMVDHAVKRFNASIEDKKRQLELGELADRFFQRIKIND